MSIYGNHEHRGEDAFIKAQFEVARLKAEVERLDTLCKQLMAQHSDISCENIMLRKAGDLLAFHYISLGRKFFPNDPLPSSISDWNSAKEGKGQP